jgi:hypothetical protein
MSDSLRRIYNAVDLLFDTRAISQESRYSRVSGESGFPITALQAFDNILPIALGLDRQARLKMIVSQQGVSVDGASAHWEFFFDLRQRRAQLVCEWSLSWDEKADDYGSASIEVAVKPFPPPDSSIRRAVREGKLLHRQMAAMWDQECKRRSDLPNKFRDTKVVVADFLQQGLDITQVEFSLSTGQSPQGQLAWIAQTRDTAYYSAFAR